MFIFTLFEIKNSQKSTMSTKEFINIMKCLWSTTLISSWNEWTKATWSNVLNYETMCNENKQIVEWEPTIVYEHL